MQIELTLLAVVAVAMCCSCGKQPAGRLLDESDIGKVFIADGVEPHPNFGKYKILISTQSEGPFYAFDSFDLVEGKPVGKLVVSHGAVPIYREVQMEPEIVQAAQAACEARMAEERRKLRELMGKPQLDEE
jgi:hypothetical protein